MKAPLIAPTVLAILLIGSASSGPIPSTGHPSPVEIPFQKHRLRAECRDNYALRDGLCDNCHIECATCSLVGDDKACYSCRNARFESLSGGKKTVQCLPACPTGYQLNGKADKLCVQALCSAGKFKSSAGSQDCLPCAPGTFSAAGATECSKCQAGQYATAGSSQCSACPAGTYSSIAGASTCLQCDLNFAFASKSGQDHCSFCPHSGATRDSNSCYRLVRPSTVDRTEGQKTIDSSRFSRDSFLFLTYQFDAPIRLRKIAVWSSTSCCKSDAKNLAFYLMFSSQLPIGECIVDNADFNDYRMINCKFDDVSLVKLTWWSERHTVTISEVAFYAE